MSTENEQFDGDLALTCFALTIMLIMAVCL